MMLECGWNLVMLRLYEGGSHLYSRGISSLGMAWGCKYLRRCHETGRN
jgi:hypothetical protein